MPQRCPRCGALQPDGPRCQSCGYKFETPIKTSQGTYVTKEQLHEAILLIIGIVGVVFLFFACAVIGFVLWGQ